VPDELDPIKWEALEPDQRVDRRIIQQSWLEDDLEIGDQIQSGDYAGMYAGEIIVPGGKYPSVEGGFRPAFASGGTAQDRIRPMYGGIILHRTTNTAAENGVIGWGTGVFEPFIFGGDIWNEISVTTGGALIPAVAFNLALSKQIPVGSDNAPRTVSTRIWRRVA
jgi:hypothetical protein